jgi:hypothetical protein
LGIERRAKQLNSEGLFLLIRSRLHETRLGIPHTREIQKAQKYLYNTSAFPPGEASSNRQTNGSVVACSASPMMMLALFDGRESSLK